MHGMGEGPAASRRDGGSTIEVIWKGPARLGECPIWDDRRNRLFWIDSLEQKVWSAEACGADAIYSRAPDIIGSIGLCEDGRLIAGLGKGFAFLDFRPGADALVEWIGDPDPAQADTRLNDGKVDRQGRFWCGSMNRDFADANAALYRLDPDLSWHRMDDGFTVSNGIVISLDGRTLYFSDSRVDRSYCYNLDPSSGALSQRREYLDTSAYAGRVDGATIDTQGNYWAALFDGAAIGCFSPEGEMVRHVPMPIRCATMCAFGGADMDVLYVTSATFSMTGQDLADEPSAGALFAIHGLGACGVPEPRFIGS